MSTVGRLTFLYPALVRAARTTGSREAGRAASVAAVPRWVRPESSFAPRRGAAVEPLVGGEGQLQRTLPAKGEQETEPVESILEMESEMDKFAANTEDVKGGDGGNAAVELEMQSPSPDEQPKSSAPSSESSATSTAENTATDSSEPIAAPPPSEPAEDRPGQSGPLDAVLHMQPPAQVAKQHPSMSPSPYVHHFDSYSFVRQLGEGGFSRDQAITAMKGIRGLLAQNLDVAQESLVSKSDVENETYLFRAACSELSTEVRNNRRLQDEHMRQQRMHLQYEVDNLTQSLNREVLTLNDNVRGMFNDRKMAVREEQNSVESAVHEISQKISIMLTSDSKSEIEGVRWILIQRSVLGILFMAFLTLGTLRYATYVSHERQKEAERMQREDEEMRRNGGKRDVTSEADAAVILAAG